MIARSFQACKKLGRLLDRVDLDHLDASGLRFGGAPGKLKYAASSEALWGLWTNDSLPSQKAQELREALAKVESEGGSRATN